MNAQTETLQFQSEAQQVLDLMIHSVYLNKDIFLRELVSNASDAIDKLRFEALTNEALTPLAADPQIRIAADGDARTLTLSDTGIGMSREEVIRYIGTIAKSGSQEFLKALRDAREAEQSGAAPDLIGQFGVGFYSLFMVADRAELVTRRAGEEKATRWESGGGGVYTLDEVEKPEHGTTITLHLKPADGEDALHDYTSEWTLREIVKKYSDYVGYPIRIKTIEKGKDGGPDKEEWETINSMKAIWMRPKEEVTEEEFREFYKHISHDWNEPLRTISLRAEGTFEYRALLFIPSKAPMDLFWRERQHGIQLYVKRVFIMGDCKEILPDYLRFVRGIVDAEDLSLNISREILQQNRHIQMMRKRLVKKVLETLKDLFTKERETYEKFWAEFGRAVKEGLFQDHENQSAIQDLMLFHSTHEPGKLTTLADYAGRMKEGQEAIYFVTGESLKAIENSPHLEAFKAKGYEVLLLAEPVDEVWSQSAEPYQGRPFKSVAKGAVTLGDEEEIKKAEEELKARAGEFKSLLEKLESALAEQVKEVRLTNRLTTSPVCLVGEAHDVTPQLEAMLRAVGQEVPQSKRILEINPNHAILARLQGVFEKDPEDPLLAEYAELLHGQALLAEGSPLPDPARFSRLVAELMVRSS